MTENEFLLADRIQKIQSVNEQYDLCKHAFISFSGGKDSVVLSKLIDLALPDNDIPRVYANTGIEYKLMVLYVKQMQQADSRIKIIAPTQNVSETLKEYGYPFKSKEHSDYLAEFRAWGFTEHIKSYLGIGGKKKDERFMCPKILRNQFCTNYSLKISSKCCEMFKKRPMREYAKQNGYTFTITGLRREEGGRRAQMKNCLTVKRHEMPHKFNPLLPMSGEWCDWFIQEYYIDLAPLYKPPYNFVRTGCRGCPYARDLQQELDKMHRLMPEEERACETLWGKVYDEYRRIGYRLSPERPLV